MTRYVAVVGAGASSKSRLMRQLSAVMHGDAVAIVRMSDDLAHVALRGQLLCSGVAGGSKSDAQVVTCIRCLVESAEIDALRARLAGDGRPAEIAASLGPTTSIVPAPAITPITPEAATCSRNAAEASHDHHVVEAGARTSSEALL